MNLSPTTKNLLVLLRETPVMFLKRNEPGKKRADLVYEELKSLSGNGFSTFENEQGMVVVRDGSARTFLI